MELVTLDSCQVCHSRRLQAFDRHARLSRCRDCGFVFDNPRPSPGDIAAYYSAAAKYDGWLDNEDERIRLWDRRLCRILCWKEPGSLLDVGAGTGQFLDRARPHFSFVEGTEVSASAVHIAREKYGLDLLQTPVESLTEKTGAYANITLFHVLEHVPDPRRTLEACRELLRDQGVLFVAVPNELLSIRNQVAGVPKFFLRLAGVRRFRWYGTHGLPRLALDGTQDEIHLSHFTPRVLAGLMKRCGFGVLELGLDPFYVRSGARHVLEKLWYRALRSLHAAVRINLYDTIWAVARKS